MGLSICLVDPQAADSFNSNMTGLHFGLMGRVIVLFNNKYTTIWVDYNLTNLIN
jgi:hypothetical protein